MISSWNNRYYRYQRKFNPKYLQYVPHSSSERPLCSGCWQAISSQLLGSPAVGSAQSPSLPRRGQCQQCPNFLPLLLLQIRQTTLRHLLFT